MKAFSAIVLQTIRSAIRAKVFHVLFALIILAVFLLPVTVSGDGTAKGLVQISITYSLGVVVALISTTTLWLSCSQLSREIETYNIHLVMAKPCPKWKLWLGKWFGIFLMHTVILLVSAALIFALIQYRVARDTAKGRFSEAEIEQLNKETRVGRRSFRPDPTQFGEAVEREYARKKADGSLTGNEESDKAEIRRQLIAKEGEVQPGTAKTWVFKGVEGKGELYLRYRIYSGSTSAMDQKTMPGLWGVRAPEAPPTVADPFVYMMHSSMGGTFQEVRIDNRAIDKINGNTVSVRYVNLPKDAEEWQGVEAASAMFQLKDGPILMVAVSSFLENYCRAMLLAIFQIAFLAALGCTVSAAFSTPVAAFVAVTYLLIGLAVRPAIDAPLTNDDGSFRYKGIADKCAHLMAMYVVRPLVVSVDDLDATSDLANGRLVENSRLFGIPFIFMLLRIVLITVAGIWIINKRELGAVIRK